jgi:fibronectin type 3 domain-containing protein
MIHRRAPRRLRIKLAAVAALVTLAAAAALVIPGLAGALDQPLITSPNDGAIENGNWDQTITFDTASNPDPSAAGYTLLRNDATGAPCDMTGASAVGSGGNAATSLVDGTTLADGRYCYWVEADDGSGPPPVTTDSDPIKITYDTTPPTATIGSKPSANSNDVTPTFTFSSSEPTGATFECAVDGGGFSACSSGITLSSLGNGSHTFAVKAIDLAGYHSTTAASYTWTVDTAPPTATIDSMPSANSSDSTPTFTFSSSEPSGATFECSTDGGSFTSCSTPKTLGSLSEGSHTFAVKAIDLAGNHSSSADSFSWNVDTVHPTATIGTKPSSPSNDTAPSFSFSSSEPSGATFECALDGVAFAACSTPKTYTTLVDGSHTFAVKAIDLAGNHSTSPASLTWIVDTISPTVPGSFQLLGANPRGFNDPPTFKFSNSSDTHFSGYQLIREGQVTSASATPVAGGSQTMTDSSIIADGSDDGIYHYSVRALDTAGNSSSTAEIVVTIDAGPPSVPSGVRTPTALTRRAPVIAWNASTGGPASYRVFRNGVSIGTVNAPATTFSDGTLPLDGSLDGTYTYTVASIDAAANQSARSLAVQITVDSTHPLPAASLAIAQSPTAAKPVLVWPGSASNDLAGYNVYRGGTQINSALITTTSVTDSGLDADGSYVYTVRAVDKAGNESADSQGASVLYDTTAPGTPGASAVAAPSGGTATVNWTPASDAGSGVAGYQVRRSAADGGPPTTLAEGTPVCGSVPPSAMGCADSGLTQGASFRYSVFAIDAVGNVSPAGLAAAITIPSTVDRTPPKAPTALHAVVSNGQISLKWKNPKDDLATVSVIWNSKRAPRSSSDGNLIYHGTGAKVTVKVPHLSAGKQVRFAVFAADKAGNVSLAARATIIVPRPSSVSLAPNGRLSGNPNLTWNAVTGATYYNVQVFEGTQASKRVSISWPAVTKYTLHGKSMKKGKTYTWYVWPGIGAKSTAKYGKLIGKVTFVYAG